MVTSFALTEPDVGSDSGAVKTRAVRDGDVYRLSGTKRYITNADKADLFTVMARTGDEPGARGVSAFLVPKALAGVTVGEPEKKMGQKGAKVADVNFDDVVVPAENRLGAEGEGFKIAMRVLDRGRLHISAVCVGVAERLIADCVAYATERKQFDRAIGTFQAVGQRMADCYIDNQAIELTMLQAASHLDEGRDDPLEVATAKFWAADGGNRIGHAALHIHGGVSIDVDFPIHRYFLWLKRYEFSLGSATPELLRIGHVLADAPVQQ